MGGRRYNTLLLGLFAGVLVFLIAASAYGVLPTMSCGAPTRSGSAPRSGPTPRTSSDWRSPVVSSSRWRVSARLLDDLLYQVDPLHPGALSVAAGFLVLIGLLASIVPALKAASVDPVRALQND